MLGETRVQLAGTNAPAPNSQGLAVAIVSATPGPDLLAVLDSLKSLIWTQAHTTGRAGKCELRSAHIMLLLTSEVSKHTAAEQLGCSSEKPHT